MSDKYIENLGEDKDRWVVAIFQDETAQAIPDFWIVKGDKHAAWPPFHKKNNKVNLAIRKRFRPDNTWEFHNLRKVHWETVTESCNDAEEKAAIAEDSSDIEKIFWQRRDKQFRKELAKKTPLDNNWITIGQSLDKTSVDVKRKAATELPITIPPKILVKAEIHAQSHSEKTSEKNNKEPAIPSILLKNEIFNNDKEWNSNNEATNKNLGMTGIEMEHKEAQHKTITPQETNNSQKEVTSMGHEMIGNSNMNREQEKGKEVTMQQSNPVNVDEKQTEAQKKSKVAGRNKPTIKENIKLDTKFPYKVVRSSSSQVQTKVNSSKLDSLPSTSKTPDLSFMHEDQGSYNAEFQEAMADISNESSEIQPALMYSQQPEESFDEQDHQKNKSPALKTKKPHTCSLEEFDKLHPSDKLNHLFAQQQTIILNQCKNNVTLSQHSVTSTSLDMDETIKLQALLPVKSVEQFIAFDANLEENRHFRQKILVFLGSATVSEDWKATIRLTLKAIMKNEVQILYSCRGQKGKKNFSNTFSYKIIATLARKCRQAPSTKEISSYLTSYLKQATSRLAVCKRSQGKADDKRKCKTATAVDTEEEMYNDDTDT